MIVIEACPHCGSTRQQTSGCTRHGKQHHGCKTGKRHCSAGANPPLIADERRTLVTNPWRKRCRYAASVGQWE